MDYLQEAKDTARSGRSLDQERAQTYAAIALVEAAQDIVSKLSLIHSTLSALLKLGSQDAAGSMGEASVSDAQVVAEVVPERPRRRTTKKSE
jgi:hypothetical protein